MRFICDYHAIGFALTFAPCEREKKSLLHQVRFLIYFCTMYGTRQSMVLFNFGLSPHDLHDFRRDFGGSHEHHSKQSSYQHDFVDDLFSRLERDSAGCGLAGRGHWLEELGHYVLHRFCDSDARERRHRTALVAEVVLSLGWCDQSRASSCQDRPVFGSWAEGSGGGRCCTSSANLDAS